MATETPLNPSRFEPNDQDHERAARLAKYVSEVGADQTVLLRGFAEFMEQFRGEDGADRCCKMGERVVDTVTGFAGVATSRVTHLHGCARVLVEGKVHDGKLVTEWIDEPRLRYADEYRGTPTAARQT